MFKDRPWIWVIVAHIVIITMVITVVSIARKNAPQEVPIVQSHGH